jgi:hypothetical protein
MTARLRVRCASETSTQASNTKLGTEPQLARLLLTALEYIDSTATKYMYVT